MNRQPPTPPNPARALLALLGAFLLVCAAFSLVITAIDGWRVREYSRWPTAEAVMDEALVTSETPFGRYGTAPIITLTCRMHFDAGGRTIRTTLYPASTRRGNEEVTVMNSWVDAHPPGSRLSVAYDPERPSHAVLCEFPSGLTPPVHPKEDAELAGGFAAGAIALAVTRGKNR